MEILNENVIWLPLALPALCVLALASFLGLPALSGLIVVLLKPKFKCLQSGGKQVMATALVTIIFVLPPGILFLFWQSPWSSWLPPIVLPAAIAAAILAVVGIFMDVNQQRAQGG